MKSPALPLLLALALAFPFPGIAPLAEAGVSSAAKGTSSRRSGSGLVSTREEMQESQKNAAEAKKAKEDLLILDRGILRTLYKNLGEYVEVPGFMSLRANRSLGSIVGPDKLEAFGLPINTIVYVRWRGTSRPELGEVYDVYTPAVVLQNKADFSDFKVRQNSISAHEDLGTFDHAGYLYETNGQIEIVDVSRGVVKARVVGSANRICLGDQIMAALPRYARVDPVESPIRMTAAIVAGSPYENLTASVGSFVYLNRGKRDGVKIGTVFQTLDSVPLMDAPPVKMTTELGKALVVHASDAFSTAIIVEQFHQIRIGSLLETARPGLSREAQFGLGKTRAGGGDDTPPGAESDGHLSELDKIEKDSDILSLSPEERERLERLHLQELKRRRAGAAFPNVGESAALPGPAVEEGGAPELPAPPSIAQARKQRDEARKRRLKQRKDEARNRDEEDLNKLFSE